MQAVADVVNTKPAVILEGCGFKRPTDGRMTVSSGTMIELSLKIGSKRGIMIVVILVEPQRARIDMIYGHVYYIT